MTTSELDKYKVDHLFLLIGENPLPNYVAANLLLNKGGIVYLVHTTDTLDEAKRLENILRSESALNSFKGIELRSLNDYESDAYYIQKEIREKLDGIKSGKIGLNYTGGTKAMSAHTYRTLFYQETKDKTYRQRTDIIFSYLDPRRLEMCIDREDNERIRIKIKPDTLPVKLVKIFELHGLELKTNPTQKVQLPQLAEELAKIFQDENKTKLWFDWYYQVFCEATRKKKGNAWGNWKSKTDLAGLSITVNTLPLEIVDVFREQNFLTSDDQFALSAIKSTGAFTEIEYFCKWLDGLWLEHYVLQKIANLANSQSIQDYGLNFEIPLTGTKDGFEFDVAFTRGYQLFAISCTTSRDRKLCKVKLFEAYLRAKQMGGDEARVALICCSDEPDSLKSEMADTLSSKKIAVFGREHLTKLAKEIEQWIIKNDQEAKK
ncbi:Card1-like endonuclease domain-containing protein [Anabaena sp. WFMT]|uniref:Card1-like endonuclease domain-containing protein n=1 Tax=Anabaena sp. WFMT TaxID=3449730 RepID=UPI003F222689